MTGGNKYIKKEYKKTETVTPLKGNYIKFHIPK